MRSCYPPRRTTVPAVQPVTLEQAKAHLSIDFADDDALLDSIIAAAVSYVDGYAGILGRCLIEQVWTQTFDGFYERHPPISLVSSTFGASFLRLPFGASEIVSLTYTDAAGASQTLSPSVYVLRNDHLGARVEPKLGQCWPSTNGSRESVTVEFKAGYGAAAEDVPAAICRGLLLMIGELYAHRENSGATKLEAIPFGAMALFAPYRKI